MIRRVGIHDFFTILLTLFSTVLFTVFSGAR